jgi:hypothetical protein
MVGDLVGIVFLSVHNMSTQAPITPLNQGFNLYIAGTTHMQHVRCHACGAQCVRKCLKYFFGEKDTLEMHKDLKQVGAMRHLWLHQQDEVANYIKPLAPFVFI